MSTYRYVATNILTGTVMADSLPLVVRSATRTICGVGKLTGYLDLTTAPAPATTLYLQALIPGQSMIWVLQDEYPVWCGVFLDSPHQSIKSNQLPIVAYTPEAILQGRLITTALTYTNQDVFAIARALVAYATSPALGPNARISGLMLGTRTSGITDTVTFGVSNTLAVGGNTYTGSYADEQPVLDALQTLAAADSFEFTFEPRLMDSTLQIAFRQAAPALGLYNTPRTLLSFPGQVIDYARPIMRSQAANYIIGTSASNSNGAAYVSQPPHGIDGYDLDQGNLLQMASLTWPGVGVTSQAQINGYVDTQLARYTAGTMVPQITLGGGTQPALTELGLGDAISFAATSNLDPPGPGGAPGLQVTARVVGWDLQPPASRQPEQLKLNLGALVGATSIGGVGIP